MMLRAHEIPVALAVVAFAATIPAANYMLGNIGYCPASGPGPCVLPVGLGLYAPSGVFVIGAALLLRDYIHENAGWLAAVLAILMGALIAWLSGSERLAVAAVVAFMLGELGDLLVYARLRARGLWLAVLASGLAGAVLDSMAFLWLAFGTLDFLAGQVVGKLVATALAAAYLLFRNRTVAMDRRKRPRFGRGR